jgi:protein O-GlcNAc transferase
MNTPERTFQNAMQALNARNLLEAERLFRQFLQARPTHFGALNLLTVVLVAKGRFGEAEPFIARAVALDASSDASFYNYGIVLKALGKRAEALAQFERAIRLNPKHVKAMINRGATLNELGRSEPALEEFDRAITADAASFEAYYNKGNALSALRRHSEARAAYARALAIQPGFADAHNNLGRALDELGRHEEALASYDAALTLEPRHAGAHFNRGVALTGLGRLDEALASYDRAIAAQPGYAEAYGNRGGALRDLQRFEAAIASYDKAIGLRPDDPEGHCNRGNILADLRRPGEAIASYDRAIALKPDYAEAHNNRGNAFKDLRRFEEAIASYDRATAAKPDYAEAYSNRGNALREAKRLEEAIASYDKAIALNPGLEFVRGEVFHTRMHACDWRRYRDDSADLATRLLAGERVVSPFIALASFDSNRIQFEAAKTWVAAKHAHFAAPLLAPQGGPRERIRVGYFSPDFRTHPMSFLMIGVFGAHDRSRFETYAFSFDNPAGDALNARLRGAFDHFIDASRLSDDALAALARQHALDIAIDLAGFTAGRRTGAFARRAAPIQVSFLGFPGTMAAPFIDYVIADATVADEAARPFFSEKIASLPHSYYPSSYGDELFAASRTFTRAELGLPEGAFVFCCFNNNYKITPDIFDIWMRIMRRAEPSVLWLFEDNPTAAANLRSEARARGVDDRRLVFAGRMPVAEHLARLGVGDLFLDTLPYNAHTTATDALWMGLPVITKPGESFAARVAASVLKAAGAPEVIVDSDAGYEAMAVELATNPDRLAAVKRRLKELRPASALFDTAAYTRALEAAYAAMQARREAGLPPDHIDIGA